jgi:UDP-glucose:(heptosyl)LPS alpha-1,3-glucosyltransferase
MRVGMCYESVLPARGGCEHYISDLARRLSRDGHQVHLFACRWDADALPADTVFHALKSPKGPRFLRPWRFAQVCADALQRNPVDVSIGFDKTWGQDILYPQGGLHSASRAHSLLKHPPGWKRSLTKFLQYFDATRYSFRALETKQYLTFSPRILVNSRMVQRHFHDYRGIPESRTRVLYSAIDPERFVAADRDRRRQSERTAWGIRDGEVAGLFVAMNYRLKGLAPLLNGMAKVSRDVPLKLVVVGGAKFQPYFRQAKSLGIADRVVFLGFRKDPRDCYFGADFLVHPTFYDPGSLVALEALACGLPVVTSVYNGNSELLTPDDNGLILHDPHDAAELGLALTEMSDRSKLDARRRSALEAGQRWTFDRHYAELLDICTEVARTKGAHPTHVAI